MAPESTAQEGLAALLAAEVDKVWGLLDVHDLKGTLPNLSKVLHALVVKYGRMSNTLAARQYVRARREAGIPGRQGVRVGAVPPLEQVRSSLDYATRGLWGPADQDALDAALTQVEGVVATLALDPGRNTVLDTVAADPQAIGWARVTEADPCYFCALLATRGAVYKAEETADFKSHDNCRCSAVAVFTAYEPPAAVRQWRADYARATRNVRGAHAKQLAWRQFYEGRTKVS